jgi:hypothetical protein
MTSLGERVCAIWHIAHRVAWRTDRAARHGHHGGMNKLLLKAVTILLAMSTWQAIHAQVPAGAVQRHADGLQLERKGDDKGAFVAFLEAAEGGYAPAQRRVAEIYDTGNPAVERDYSESIRWYELARAGGEQVPSQLSPIPSTTRP